MLVKVAEKTIKISMNNIYFDIKPLEKFLSTGNENEIQFDFSLMIFSTPEIARRNSINWIKQRFNENKKIEFIHASEKEWFAVLDKKNEHNYLFTTKNYLELGFLGAFSQFFKFKYPKGNAFTLHCSGIKIKNNVILFVGASGNGKTTLSKAASERGYEVLSDETVLIKKGNRHYFAHSTPFGKITDGPISEKIKCIFFLEHSKENYFIPLKASESTRRAWTDSTYRTQIVSVEERKIIFNNIFDMFSSIPCYEMRFRKDFEEWDKLIDLCENS